MIDARLLVDDEGHSLYGLCGYCQRNVDNFDDQHRVSGISRGDRGVECVLRGDIESIEAAPLNRASYEPVLPAHNNQDAG